MVIVVFRMHVQPQADKPRHDRLCWLSHKFVGNNLDMPSWKLRKIRILSL